MGAGIQGYSCLDSEFEASLGYLRPCYKTNEQLREELEARTRDKSQPKGQWRFLGTPRCWKEPQRECAVCTDQPPEWSDIVLPPVVFCPSPAVLCCSSQISDNPPALRP